MKDITKEYYKANPEMVEKLIETDTAELIHRGPRIDGFWGVDKNDNKNHHGKILMELREKFKNGINFDLICGLPGQNLKNFDK